MSTKRLKHQSYQSYQSTHIFQPSDYESDGNYLSDLPAPPIERTDEELNLSVLKRHNRDVISLEYVAPYVVVYEFSTDSQQWEKSGVEGTAFVCGLMPTVKNPHRYAVTVLNRRGLDNFHLELLSTSDVEVTEEYLILQSASDGAPKVYGLWVFSEPPPSSTSHHRSTIAEKIQWCAEKVEAGRSIAEERQGYEREEDIEEGVPMGRQVSLQELFGQQRQQDDAWSVRSHSPTRPTAQFKSTADTDFFRTSQRHAQTRSPVAPAQSNGQTRDVLIDLFRKAGENYRSTDL